MRMRWDDFEDLVAKISMTGEVFLELALIGIIVWAATTWIIPIWVRIAVIVAALSLMAMCGADFTLSFAKRWPEYFPISFGGRF